MISVWHVAQENVGRDNKRPLMLVYLNPISVFSRQFIFNYVIVIKICLYFNCLFTKIYLFLLKKTDEEGKLKTQQKLISAYKKILC